MCAWHKRHLGDVNYIVYCPQTSRTINSFTSLFISLVAFVVVHELLTISRTCAYVVDGVERALTRSIYSLNPPSKRTRQQGLPEEWANLLPEGTTVQTAPPTVSPKHAKRNSHIAAPVRRDEERSERAQEYGVVMSC